MTARRLDGKTLGRDSVLHAGRAGSSWVYHKIVTELIRSEKERVKKDGMAGVTTVNFVKAAQPKNSRYLRLEDFVF